MKKTGFLKTGSAAEPLPVGNGDEVRYEVIEDPFGRFQVFDRERRAPAEHQGAPLVGLDREAAGKLAAMLNNRASDS